MEFLTAPPAFSPLPWMLLIVGLGCLALAGLRTRKLLQHRKRRKRQKNQQPVGLTIGLYTAAAVLLLLALLSFISPPAPSGDPSDTTPPQTGASHPSDGPGATADPDETTEPPFGWMEDEGGIYYLKEDGNRATGWLDLDGRRYWLDEDGYTLSGWQALEGILRYFREDGSMARGEEEIDGKTCFFTSTGAQILMVNPWHAVPEDYVIELTELSSAYATDGNQVDVRMYDALIEMMDACNRESGSRCCVLSGYRSKEDQEYIFNNKVRNLMNEGLTREEAEVEAATVIAVPGTSEHQLGLAVDIIDTQLWALELEQEDLEAQQWLMEHCWEYGFILRYPADKTGVTGIIYEPWHYRYVGRELAKEITDLGLTLEEYLDSLD